MIQEIMSLLNIYNDNLFSYLSDRERKKMKLTKLELQIQNHQKKKIALEDELKAFKYIQVVQSPDNNILPQKAKTKRNLIIGAMAGFFLMLILSFFLDFIFRLLKQKEN
jgi:LPS O-antigen subunit length determinant protein (WzzB/FepE family)